MCNVLLGFVLRSIREYSSALHWRSQQAFLNKTARPALLPATFSGDGSFVDWLDHFKTVAEVNAWDKVAMALWLHFRLVGRAQNPIKCLSETERED